MESFPHGVRILLEQSSSCIYIFILYTFFSCCTFKSHALLETVLSAFILNHMTQKLKEKRANSIQDQCCIVSTLEYQTLFLCKPTVCNCVCVCVCAADGKLYEICQNASKNTHLFSSLKQFVFKRVVEDAHLLS